MDTLSQRINISGDKKNIFVEKMGHSSLNHNC